MNAQERLRQVIDARRERLRAGVPADREAALLALLAARDRRTPAPGVEAPPDLITGRRLADLGGNLALHLCLAAGDAAPSDSAPVSEPATWAASFLRDCDDLAAADLVLGHCETGFMRLVEADDATFAAWIATKRAPTGWRERADLDWWAGWLAASTVASGDAPDRRPAEAHLARMTYQLGYPPDAEIGGCAIRVYRDVLACLITRALAEREPTAPPVPRSEREMVAALAASLDLDPAIAARALAAFTLDRESAGYHAAPPGVAAAPLVRLAPDRVVWSRYGLLTEPLLFLTRELRRRDPQDYHNTAHLRERQFRDDLYALFADRRFVTSTGRITLRRAAGDVRTDVDAIIFDRKSGTLALFELKSQDPFARSPAELARQRDNVLYANRQLGGVLDWVARHGADEILARVDRRVARTFRVQKVLPFVLGRYLVHFNDGPAPDRRAAWGTWPQVLRLLDGRAVRAGDANPLVSLFARLTNDPPPLAPPATAPPREIDLGATHLTVYPSYAALQAGASGAG